MKKQMNNIVTAVSVMALLGAVSCNKEKGVEGAGSAIRFGVSTVYENGPATKTEYSGKDQNGNSISGTSTAERIDWLEGDVIRILCQQATVEGKSEKYADYAITPETDASSKATIDPVSSGLQWGEGSHNFFALYPSPEQNDVASIFLNGDGATVTGTVPATQTATLSGHVFKPDMDNAYMYAYTTVPSGSSVTLDFHPLVTTLEFTLLTRAGNQITSNLTSVELSSTQSDAYLAGTFTASLTTTSGLTPVAKSNISSGSESNVITINLPDDGVQLSTDPTEAYTVTFLMLPMDQTKLTLTLNFAGGITRTLELKDNGSWITVPACRKTYIWKVDAPLTVDTYVFTVTDPSDLVYSGGTSTTGSVVSYKYHGSDIPANRSNIAWNVEGYYPTEADALAGTNKYAAISSTYMTAFTPSSTTGSYAGESVNISYGAGSGTSTTVDLSSEITAKLTSNAGAYVQRGTSGSYWNLANPTTGSTSSIAETANTYIVNAPGYYCFPLVMGNGIKNDSKNTVAYRQTNFKNYKGTSLNKETSSPLLNDQGGTPTAAYIVWEEADMVALEDKTTWTLPSGCITSSSMTIDTETKTVYWLNFQITDAIQQGCIILAVTDGTNVMWSWTVWVTDYVPKNYSDYDVSSDLADVECTYDAAGNKVTFMPRNLGWVEGGSTTGTLYPQTSVFVRLNQTGTTNYVVMEVTKPEGSVVTGGSAGHNPYYQWGRKDALMPSDGTNNTLSPLYGKTTTFQTINAKQAVDVTIKNPDRRYGSSSSPADWCSTTDDGWWCAGNTDRSVDKPTVKTIYDPSPAGYTIPRYNAFLGFRLGTTGTLPNANGDFANGYYFWNGYRASSSASTDGMKTIFFPASGCRNAEDGALSDVTSYAGCWSAMSSSNTNGYSLIFNFEQLAPMKKTGRRFGFAVRPSQEQYISSGANTAGQDIYHGDSVNSSWGK